MAKAIVHFLSSPAFCDHLVSLRELRGVNVEAIVVDLLVLRMSESQSMFGFKVYTFRMRRLSNDHHFVSIAHGDDSQVSRMRNSVGKRVKCENGGCTR